MNALKALLRTGVLSNKVRRDYKLIGHMQTRETKCPGLALMTELSTWEHFDNRNFTEPDLISEHKKYIQQPSHQKYGSVNNPYLIHLFSP